MHISKKNEVYLLLNDLSSSENQEFSDFFTFEVPNARFMPAYRNRIWDGNDFEPTRKTAKTKRISGRRCTANIMLQQTVFEKWQGKQNDMSRAIGTSARFLTQRPKSTMGERAVSYTHLTLPTNREV